MIPNSFLVQESAACHMPKETIGYLTQYATVQPNWPFRSPDLNPIRNLWGIRNWGVEEQGPDSFEQMILLAFQA
jgi:hypothetical protein